MGAHYRSHPGNEVGLVPHCPDRSDEFVEVGWVGVDDPEPLDRVPETGEVLGNRGQRLLAGALSSGCGHLADPECDQGLDVQQIADEGLGSADPATAMQEVEGVEGGEQVGGGAGVAGQLLHGLDPNPGGGELSSLDDGQAHGCRYEFAVDDPDRNTAAELLGCRHRGLVRGGDLRRQADDHHAVGALVGEPSVGVLEPSHRWGRGLWERRIRGESLPEVVDAQLLAIDQILLAEADGQRDHGDPVSGEEIVGEVARRVRDDADHGASRGRPGDSRRPEVRRWPRGS